MEDPRKIAGEVGGQYADLLVKKVTDGIDEFPAVEQDGVSESQQRAAIAQLVSEGVGSYAEGMGSL